MKQGKTTKLIAESEQDTFGLPVPNIGGTAITNPIPESISPSDGEAYEADGVFRDEEPLKNPIDTSEPTPYDEPVIDNEEGTENEERKSKSRRNLILLALGGLALLLVANS